MQFNEFDSDPDVNVSEVMSRSNMKKQCASHLTGPSIVAQVYKDVIPDDNIDELPG
ncbi:UNVERIFIED_CONTAM: hypothetical protein Sindi_1389900 [Sesamum indicum]